MAKTKTARFTALVQRAGKPETLLLWQDPKKDPAFQDALHGNRLLTVLREPHGKEYGVVGFKRNKTASYLVFPRPLRGFDGKRIVGIKYEQVAPSKPVGKPIKPTEKQSRSTPAPRPQISKARQFEVTLRVTAIGEETFVVDATSSHEARRAALQAAEQKTPDLGKAKITRRVARIKRT
jgi:hypothetical protein